MSAPTTDSAYLVTALDSILTLKIILALDVQLRIMEATTTLFVYSATVHAKLATEQKKIIVFPVIRLLVTMTEQRILVRNVHSFSTDLMRI